MNNDNRNITVKQSEDKLQTLNTSNKLFLTFHGVF